VLKSQCALTAKAVRAYIGLVVKINNVFSMLQSGCSGIMHNWQLSIFSSAGYKQFI